MWSFVHHCTQQNPFSGCNGEFRKKRHPAHVWGKEPVAGLRGRPCFSAAAFYVALAASLLPGAVSTTAELQHAAHVPTSSDSDRNSCMMSLSPMTRMEHTAGHRAQVRGRPRGGSHPSRSCPKDRATTPGCSAGSQGQGEPSQSELGHVGWHPAKSAAVWDIPPGQSPGCRQSANGGFSCT